MATACKLRIKNKDRIYITRRDGPLKITLTVLKTNVRSKKKNAAFVSRRDVLSKLTFLRGELLGTRTQRRRQDLLSVYTLGKELGRGTFGVTRKCKHNMTGEKFACKSNSKQGMTPQDIEDVKSEVQIMQRLAAKDNIVRLKDVYEDKDFIHLVMERCFGGQLWNRLLKKRRYSEREAASLCTQIVEAVQTCHSAGVMHRDLKMDNILFSTKKEDSRIKLIDFGLSVFFKPGEVFGQYVGSLQHMAPEIYTGRYSNEVDLWSVGVILYTLLCGSYPFRSSETMDIRDVVLQGDIDFSFSPWPQITYGAKDLVKKMLEVDPEKRLTASEVLSHPWIRGGV